MRDGDVVLSCLELAFTRDSCSVQTPNSGITVARLNKRTQLSLVLIERPEILTGKVHYRALLPLAELRRRLELASQLSIFGSSQASWSMSILLTGPRSISQVLATELSRQRLYLQHPSTVPDDMSYENPQYLTMVGSSFSNGAVLAPIVLELSQESNDTEEAKVASRQTETGGLDGDVVDVITMLDQLPRHDYLMEPPVDDSIKTVLLP